MELDHGPYDYDSAILCKALVGFRLSCGCYKSFTGKSLYLLKHKEIHLFRHISKIFEEPNPLENKQYRWRDLGCLIRFKNRKGQRNMHIKIKGKFQSDLLFCVKRSVHYKFAPSWKSTKHSTFKFPWPKKWIFRNSFPHTPLVKRCSTKRKKIVGRNILHTCLIWSHVIISWYRL
jgi:hypothetical protein